VVKDGNLVLHVPVETNFVGVMTVEMLTIDEASRKLRVNKKTLLKSLEAGKVPRAIRIGSKWRIPWPPQKGVPCPKCGAV